LALPVNEACYDAAQSHCSEDSTDPRLAVDSDVGAGRQKCDTDRKCKDLSNTRLGELAAHGIHIGLSHLVLEKAPVSAFLLSYFENPFG
jgi:hypothetical protein